MIGTSIQDTLGIEIEYNENTEEFLFRSTQQNTGEPIDFFNGFKKTTLSGSGWDSHSLILRSISPLPMQINALSIELETGGILVDEAVFPGTSGTVIPFGTEIGRATSLNIVEHGINYTSAPTLAFPKYAVLKTVSGTISADETFSSNAFEAYVPGRPCDLCCGSTCV